MRTVTLVATITEHDGEGGRRELDRKTYVDLDVMKTGQVRSWLKRRLNWHMRRSDLILIARYDGQLKEPPHAFYQSDCRAVGGRIMSDWDER